MSGGGAQPQTGAEEVGMTDAVLGREVADAWTPGMFYNAVLQPVLLYGSEIWVMLPRIGRTLVGFHHRVVHILTGRQPWRVLDGA